MDYYITKDGELHHAWLGKGKAADDHKYIKREWKNGRWQYTYRSDAKKTAKSNSLFGNKTTITTASGYKSTSYKSGKIDSIFENFRRALNEYSEGRKRDWAESKERADKKAKEKAKDMGAELKDVDRGHSSTTTISVGNKTVSKTYNRGTTEKYIETAKEYIKDRLGFDEKDRLDEASNNQALSTFRYAGAKMNYDNATRTYRQTTSEEDKQEALKDLKRYRKEYEDANDEFDQARADYMKTPISVLTNPAAHVKQAMESAKDWIDDVTGNKKTQYYTSRNPAEEVGTIAYEARVRANEQDRKNLSAMADRLPKLQKNVEDLSSKLDRAKQNYPGGVSEIEARLREAKKEYQSAMKSYHELYDRVYDYDRSH